MERDCDGHVRFLRNEMEYRVYKALSTRAGGEIVSMVTPREASQ